MDARERLVEHLQQEREEILSLVQGMVRIPSENPPGDTTDLFHFVTDYLDQRRLDYDVVDPEPTMPNLVASFEGGEPGEHLVLNGHLDIFPAGDPSLWSDDPYAGIIRDGKLFGRGVSDMKAGTAASILTYVYLAEIREHLKGKLTLTAVSDEETAGPWGARYLMEHRPDVLGDCVLNGEPSTPGTVRFGEKGPVWLELRVDTEGGHGGYTYASPNAIKVAAAIIRDLEAVTEIEVPTPPEVVEKIEGARDALNAQLGEQATDTLLQVTLNIGMIDGGIKMNMIAADCRVEVDIRCPVGVPNAVVLERFEDIISHYPGTSYTLINSSEPNYCDPNHPMMDIIQQNAEQARGIRPVPAIGLGGTDCRLWRQRGIPAFVYGPTPYNMGAPDEYVTIEDLMATVEVHVLSAYDYLTK
jgi:succinyl-diaminopimelate desuccinylase